MSKYNIFQAMFMSFYSRKLYKDVGKNWGGKTFFYLFILLALSWIGQTFLIQSSLSRLYSRGSDVIVSQIPIITVLQGKVSTPEKKPYLIYETKGGKLFAIIDTTGKYTDLSKADGNILITETKIISKPNEHEERVYKIPSAFSSTLNPITINGYVSHVISFAWVFIFLALLVFTYVYRLMQVLLYSIIGKIFSAITGSHVTFVTIMQITMIAITPSIALATGLDFFGYSFPHQSLTYFIISMIYMAYGIRANKN